MKIISAVTCLMVLVMPMDSIANQSDLKSRAERTGYKETSRYADVMEFIAKLQQASSDVRVESFAVTNEKRALPLVILSRPAVSSPAQARMLGKPIVFIMANIHAGEVEGKEAAQHLMRDVATGPLASLLDHLVLLVAPIYNADGNERIDINNRTAQNGPVTGVGVRENAQRLDLNRDFMKLETPEARGLIEGVFNRWDPHVIIDLHTTNGSYHGYALTYSPTLHPNSDARLVSFVRERLLPDVTKTMRVKHNYKIYFYGNFADEKNPFNELAADKAGEPKAWATFDYRPRFGNNYGGLRNRLAILSEAYSYLDFNARVDVTDKFVRTILQYIARNAGEVINLVREADRHSTEKGTTYGNEEGFGISFELKPSTKPVTILVGSVRRVEDPRTNKPRFEATNEARPVKMIEFGEFRATRRIKPPVAYVLKSEHRHIARLLQSHGIVVEAFTKDEELDVEQYLVSDIKRAARAFQGHKEARLTVSTSQARVKFEAGAFLVSMLQPKAALIFYLLEPESDDGVANWNLLDEEMDRAMKGNAPTVFPIYRLKTTPRVPREVLKNIN